MLDENMKEYQRDVYNMVNLFGDIGGALALLQSLALFLFSEFFQNKFFFSQLKAHYLVNTKEKEQFKRSSTIKNRKKVLKYKQSVINKDEQFRDH